MDINAIASEQSVIGAALLDPERTDDVPLAPEDFANLGHAITWRTLRAMRDTGETVDVLTVAETLERRGDLDRVGGLSYLTELVHNTPSAANISRYAKAVMDRSVRRKLLAALAEIGKGVEGGQDVAEVLGMAQDRIMSIGAKAETSAPVHVMDIARERLNVLDDRYSGNDDGRSTGLTDLDEKLGKIRPGDLVVIAGRPGMGKSAFAMQLIESMSSSDRPGLFFSLEMSAGQLVDRILSSAGRVNLKKFRSADFHDEDWTGLTAALGSVQGMPVYIDDHATGIGQILSTMRAFKRRHGGIGAVVVDYIGLVQSEGDTREQEIARVTRALKLTAKQLGCPILALSQLNRKVEDRGDRRPLQSDLRESGAVEQDADAILMLYRDEVYDKDSEHKGICEVLIRKNRHGETGMVPVVFRADVVRFENYAGQYVPSQHTSTRRKSRAEV